MAQSVVQKAIATVTLATSMVTSTGCNPHTQQQEKSDNSHASRVTLDDSQRKLAADYRKATNPADKDNLYNVLKSIKFKDVEGHDVNINALQTAMGDNFTTLTFGFGECTTLCPTINGNLAKIADQHKHIESIFVSVDPKADYSTKEAREAYVSAISERGLPRNKINILFPTNAAEAQKLASVVDPNAVNNAANPKAHNASITLYAPGGQKLAQEPGMQPYEKLNNVFGGYFSAVKSPQP